MNRQILAQLQLLLEVVLAYLLQCSGSVAQYIRSIYLSPPFIMFATPAGMFRALYTSLFDNINVRLEPRAYLFWSAFFFVLYVVIFCFLSILSRKFRFLTPLDKKVHIVLQSVKFSNKLVINIICGGALFLWDDRLMNVDNWSRYKDIFYNLSSIFAWSDIIALLINRKVMTVQCQLHHAGNYLFVFSIQRWIVTSFK